MVGVLICANPCNFKYVGAILSFVENNTITLFVQDRITSNLFQILLTYVKYVRTVSSTCKNFKPFWNFTPRRPMCYFRKHSVTFVTIPGLLQLQIIFLKNYKISLPIFQGWIFFLPNKKMYSQVCLTLINTTFCSSYLSYQNARS